MEGKPACDAEARPDTCTSCHFGPVKISAFAQALERFINHQDRDANEIVGDALTIISPAESPSTTSARSAVKSGLPSRLPTPNGTLRKSSFLTFQTPPSNVSSLTSTPNHHSVARTFRTRLSGPSSHATSDSTISDPFTPSLTSREPSNQITQHRLMAPLPLGGQLPRSRTLGILSTDTPQSFDSTTPSFARPTSASDAKRRRVFTAIRNLGSKTPTSAHSRITAVQEEGSSRGDDSKTPTSGLATKHGVNKSTGNSTGEVKTPRSTSSTKRGQQILAVTAPGDIQTPRSISSIKHGTHIQRRSHSDVKTPVLTETKEYHGIRVVNKGYKEIQTPTFSRAVQRSGPAVPARRDSLLPISKSSTLLVCKNSLPQPSSEPRAPERHDSLSPAKIHPQSILEVIRKRNLTEMTQNQGIEIRDNSPAMPVRNSSLPVASIKPAMLAWNSSFPETDNIPPVPSIPKSLPVSRSIQTLAPPIRMSRNPHLKSSMKSTTSLASEASSAFEEHPEEDDTLSHLPGDHTNAFIDNTIGYQLGPLSRERSRSITPPLLNAPMVLPQHITDPVIRKGMDSRYWLGRVQGMSAALRNEVMNPPSPESGAKPVPPKLNANKGMFNDDERIVRVFARLRALCIGSEALESLTEFEIAYMRKRRAAEAKEAAEEQSKEPPKPVKVAAQEKPAQEKRSVMERLTFRNRDSRR